MKKLNLLQVKKQLNSGNLKIFTTVDLKLMFGASQRATEAFLSYNTRNGAFIRLKKGLYALADQPPSDFYLANRLYFPSYVSLNTALSYYHLIPETVYAVTSVTPKSTREFNFLGRSFIYRRIKKQAYSGYIPKNISGETIYIAAPEKAAADFLYFIYLGKGTYNDRLKKEKLDFIKLKKYLQLFSQPKLASFAGKLLNHKL